jgi:hypothetical protein
MLLPGIAGAALAGERHYEGTAYAADGKVAYREEHWLGENSRLVLYRCADGAPFARKRVAGGADAVAPDFELVDGRDGYREGVRGEGATRTVFYRAKTGAPEKSAPLPATKGAVIDAGFDAYVRKHWDELGEARDLHIPFLVPDHLGYLDLKLATAGEATESGTAVRRLRMRLDAWYGFVAPTLQITYTASDHRLLRFEGISNVRDAAGHNQHVRIEFPRAATPAAMDVATAAALPLVQRCGAGEALK